MKSNNLKYNVSLVAKDGRQFDIKIRLNDECKNGHQDFSITGSIYEAGKNKIDRNLISGGAIGDEIAKEFPQFAIFNDLHLCDFNGAPMYAPSNGFYHLENSKPEVVKEYLRITDKEFEAIKNCADQKHLAYLLINMGVVERWKEEANEAIKLLENLTGDEFVNDSERSQFDFSNEDYLEAESKAKSGYYKPNNVEERKQKELSNKLEKAKQDIRDRLSADIREHQVEADIKIAILDLGILNSNYIFYNHTSELAFNWLDYEKKFTPEQMEQIKVKVLEIIPCTFEDKSKGK